MKKIIFVICFLSILAVQGQAGLSAKQEAAVNKAVEQAVAQQGKKVSKEAQVKQQLEIIAARLQKELKKPVSPKQVVAWMYFDYTADFEVVAYEQFKFERSQEFDRLLQAKDTKQEELDDFMRHIPKGSPEAKEFAAYFRHVIDASFAYVFPEEYTAELYEYGYGPTHYSSGAYPAVKNKVKFKKDLLFTMENMYGGIKFLSETDDKTFHDSWDWLIEGN